MKKFLLSLLILNFSFLIFSMPGFESYIPDTSGDFIYYKDNSFVRESYVGILMYNESTFQVRYYAPVDKENKLPEMDIGLLISIDPKSDYWNMTGERLITQINNTAEEIDVLNYLHDILYEFSSRRNKVSNITPDNPNYSTSRNFYNNGISVKQEYPQFGGNVYITFDPIIPFFNIKTITDLSGKTLMQVVLSGKIKDSSDTSFSDFKGFGNGKFSTKLEKQNKKATELKIKTLDNNSITLDSNWKEAIEGYNNIHVFGDEAIVYLTTVENSETSALFALMTFLKAEIQSSCDSYIDLREIECLLNIPECKLKIVKKATEINKNKYIGIGYYSKQKNSNNIDAMYLSTTMHAYTVRKAYYDKIIASYTTDN